MVPTFSWPFLWEMGIFSYTQILICIYFSVNYLLGSLAHFLLGFAGCALEASSHWCHLSSLPLDITSKYFLGVYQLGFPLAWGACSPSPLKQLHWPIFLPCFWIPDHDSACQRSVKFPKFSSGSRGGHLPVWGHWNICWYKMINVD